MKAIASVEETEEENDNGYSQVCVYATCEESGHTVGPIWGVSDASYKRAFATLTEECDCGADWHGED